MEDSKVDSNGGARARGTGLLSINKWIAETYGPKVHRRLLKAVSPETAEALQNALPATWYPVEHTAEIWRALRDELPWDSSGAFEQAMTAQGEFIAQDNLSTVFRVLLIFVRGPEQMFKQLPKFWHQYFDGIEVELDESEIDQGKGVCTVHNLGRVEHLSPVAAGWIDFGLRKVGAEEVHVEEECYTDGATAGDPLRFHLSWS